MIRWRHRIVRAEDRADGEERVTRQRRLGGDGEPSRRGFGHPARDVEVDAVRASDRDRDVRVRRVVYHLEVHPGERMKRVVHRDA